MIFGAQIEEPTRTVFALMCAPTWPHAKGLLEETYPDAMDVQQVEPEPLLVDRAGGFVELGTD